MRRIFGPKIEERKERWRNLYYEELQNWHSSPNNTCWDDGVNEVRFVL
jgi:hypothetical protein